MSDQYQEIPNKMSFSIKPVMDQMTQSFGYEMRGIMDRVSRQVASAKEEATRTALKALGWMSPEEAKAISDERDALLRWKREQMQVESTWSEQTVGRLLGLSLGDHIRAGIQLAVERLISERDWHQRESFRRQAAQEDAERDLAELRACCDKQVEMLACQAKENAAMREAIQGLHEAFSALLENGHHDTCKWLNFAGSGCDCGHEISENAIAKLKPFIKS